MMTQKVVVIGGDGLIGRALQRHPYSVEMTFYSHTLGGSYKYFDINDANTWGTIASKGYKRAILLSWLYLDDYNTKRHFTENLSHSIMLVDRLINNGLTELVVAGTCYEYGNQSGCLSPNLNTKPLTSYAIAKDSLNKVLSHMCSISDVRFCWARIFYPYSIDQRKTSLFPALLEKSKLQNNIIELGNPDLIRDFIPTEDVAKCLVNLISNKSASGVFNCGSGNPISLRTFVEKIIKKYSLCVEPRFNMVQPRKFEPMAFWADMSNWDELDI